MLDRKEGEEGLRDIALFWNKGVRGRERGLKRGCQGDGTTVEGKGE